MIPSLVIFDCDGVLVDSEPLAAQALADSMRSLGLRATGEEVDRRFRGRSLSDCVASIEQDMGGPVPPDFLTRLNATTYAAFEAELEPVLHVAHALQVIRAHEVPVCVASSGSHEKMALTLGLTGLRAYFGPNLFSATEVKQGKPAPDLFLHAARRMGVPIGRAVVVEDSLPGLQGAVSSGAQVFGYVNATLSDAVDQKRAVTSLGGRPFSDMRTLPELLGLEPVGY